MRRGLREGGQVVRARLHPRPCATGPRAHDPRAREPIAAAPIALAPIAFAPIAFAPASRRALSIENDTLDFRECGFCLFGERFANP